MTEKAVLASKVSTLENVVMQIQISNAQKQNTEEVRQALYDHRPAQNITHYQSSTALTPDISNQVFMDNYQNQQ